MSGASGAALAQGAQDTVTVGQRPAPPPRYPVLSDVLYLPFLFGIRAPAYDRSDGLSLPWGPQLALPDDRVVVDGLITYRSRIGRFDPSLSGVGQLTRRFAVRGTLERATLTNDAWSAPGLINSATTLVVGLDGRNYFRADRAEVAADWHDARADESLGWSLSLGVRDEFDESIGPPPGATEGAWTMFHQTDKNGILRPNPPIATGHIASVIAGASGHWVIPGQVASHPPVLPFLPQPPRNRGTMDATFGVEAPWTTPPRTIDGPPTGRFVQATGDVRMTYRTFGDATFLLTLHGLVTFADTAPPQRYSYVGGLNTIPTLTMLERGGDELAFAEALYLVPLKFISVPVAGSPLIGPHFIVGGAAVQRFPPMTQNAGVRVQWFVLEFDFLIDPKTHRRVLSIGGAVPPGL